MKAQFISRVMQIMNELGWNDAGYGAFIGSDATKVETHIETVFVDAWRKAVNSLPKSYFEVKDFSSNKAIVDIHSGTGYVILPEDFYLLYRFKMKGWQKSIETLHNSSDPIAAIQANEFTRGNAVRPVCVKNITKNTEEPAETVDVLEYYSLPKGREHEVECALYIPLIAPLSDGTILGEKLFTPLAYICASLVFDIFEKHDIAKILEAEALEMIV